MTELVSSKLMHVDEEGQQKLDGSLWLLHWLYELGHVLESLGQGVNERAGIGVTVAKMAKAKSIEGRLPGISIVLVLPMSVDWNTV